MAINLSTLSVLAPGANNQVFMQVVSHRSIRFDELMKSTGFDRDVTKQALQELEKAHLIQEKGAGVEDFNIYFVTADGLELDREVRRYG